MLKENLQTKLERVMTKVALYQVREILIQEKYKGYYRHDTNIQESIELSRTKCLNSLNFEYDKVETIVYWSNGFYEFRQRNEFNPIVLSKKMKK